MKGIKGQWRALLHIRRVSWRRVKRLQELYKSPQAVLRAAQQGELRLLDRFGDIIERNIVADLPHYLEQYKR